MTKTKYNFKKAKRQLTSWQKVFLQSVKKKKKLKIYKGIDISQCNTD